MLKYLTNWLLFIALFATICVPRAVYADEFERELWRGTMSQTSPMPWQGKMELYLKFDPEADLPTKVKGIITWHDLGKAQTTIEGELRGDGNLSFREVSCVSGDCSKVVLGGEYRARVDEHAGRISGSATGMFNLKGSFLLKRVKS